MELKEIGKLFYSRYFEIYNRINKYLDKFAYATYSKEEILEWYFNDEDRITIVTYNHYDDECDYYKINIDYENLETDESFEKWIDVRYNERKKREDEQKAYNEEYEKERRQEMYEKLKKEFE